MLDTGEHKNRPLRLALKETGNDVKVLFEERSHQLKAWPPFGSYIRPLPGILVFFLALVFAAHRDGKMVY